MEPKSPNNISNQSQTKYNTNTNKQIQQGQPQSLVDDYVPRENPQQMFLQNNPQMNQQGYQQNTRQRNNPQTK